MLKMKNDFANVKAEMSAKEKQIKESIKAVNKRHKEKEKKAKQRVNMSQADKRLIEQLTHRAKYYSTSSVLPVKVGEIIINYKILPSFLKKLDGYETALQVLDRELVLHYWKKSTLTHGKGVLRLYDLTEYFYDFTHVPEAILDETP